MTLNRIPVYKEHSRESVLYMQVYIICTIKTGPVFIDSDLLYNGLL